MRKPYNKLHFAKTLILAKKSHGEIYFFTGYNYCEIHLNLHEAKSNLQYQISVDLMEG